MRILVTNDDGYLAPGINTLADALADVGEVTVVAPDREQSATSHSLTLHRPLRMRQTAHGRYHVDGTPADCVMLAVNALLDEPPDFLFSGINHGGNMGDDVSYSGTVSAAKEGTLLGIKSIAISLVGGKEAWLPGYIQLVRDLAKRIVDGMAGYTFPPDTLLNVNLPDCDPGDVKGMRVTTLGKRLYIDPVVTDTDPHGKRYYWIGGGAPSWEGGESADFRAVREGYISLTPVEMDFTNHAAVPALKAWQEAQARDTV